MYGSNPNMYRLQKCTVLNEIFAAYSNVRIWIKYVPLTAMYGSKLNMCHLQ
jgi:hypothetical protein